MKLKKKSLLVALAGMTMLGINVAEAVNVNPAGTGQVLLYPYYTVNGAQNPFNTLIEVVNTTASTKSVKVRFREGKASADVLDFNLFLSPGDTWVAALEPTSTGTKLTAPDKSCTVPKIPSTGVEFRNYDYLKDAVGDDSLARTREGYFEIIEMATYESAGAVAVAVKPDKDGNPKDCTVVNNDDTIAKTLAKAPNGGLMGSATLVAPGAGFNISTVPTALENFTGKEIYGLCCNAYPNLDSGDSKVVGTATFDTGVDAVTAALTKKQILNEYVLDVNTNSATDWVVTFPTKNFYVDGTAADSPFTKVLGAKGACEPTVPTLWNREGSNQTLGADFSPPGDPNLYLCWESTVVSFNNRNIFSSSNMVPVTAKFMNGWASLDFATQSISSNNEVIFKGLPSIGFAAYTFPVSATTAYAGSLTHRYTTDNK